MKNKKTYVIAIFFLIIVLALLTVAFILGNQIPMNPAGTVGNTAGNLNNSGLFCEYNGKVYFSNSYDNGSLYSMDVNEGSIKKLNNMDAQNILAAGKYLYYFHAAEASGTGISGIGTPKAFNRCNLKGQKTISLTRDIVITAQLVDNHIYYLTNDNDGPAFKKIKIDKTEETKLADYVINPACAVNSVIYYNGTVSNHYLYGLNTTTGVSNEIWHGNIWNPILEGDYVYYMDVAENYRLCRYSLSQNVVEVLTNDRVDCFNVGSGYIYYQKNGDSPSLNFMYTDGTGVQVLAEGNYTNINMTSQYVYFQAFGDDTTTYHAYLGTTGYGSFDNAKTAALEQSSK